MDKLSLLAVLPEIILLTFACVIPVLDLWVKAADRQPTYVWTLVALLLSGLSALQLASSGQTLYGFGGMVVSDPMGNWLKVFSALALAVTLVYARPYAGSRDMLRTGELFTLSLFALLGMNVMVSGQNLLVVYLGIELLTLASYALVALRRDHAVATEAAMKYFVLAALASGFLLYGMSLLYGATGTLDLRGLSAALQTGQVNGQVLVFGLVFLVAGLAFKLGAAPFHMWLPDVYQGAPTAVTLLIAAAPKLAAFGIAMRLLVEGLLPSAVHWQGMLAVLVVVSLAIGNLAALVQSNVKRMLAYSTISHMGFLLIGVMSGVVGSDASAAGSAYGSAMFYVVTYVATTLATFGVLLLLSRSGFESDEVADFAGLNQKSPLYAGIMALCLFSLAGVPPLVGFYAKLAVLEALVAAGGSANLYLAVYAVVMSLIGAFYYLRLVKVMYFDAPSQDVGIEAPMSVRAVLSLNGAVLLVLGLLPGGLLALCSESILAMMRG